MSQNERFGRSTGPKTTIGKNRVKLNAFKHGIFAQIALLKSKFDMPTELFDELVAELRNSFQPRSPLELILIDKLAITFLRLGRLYWADAEVMPLFLERFKENLAAVDNCIVTMPIERADEIAFFHKGPSLEVLLKYEGALDRQVSKILDQIEQARRIVTSKPEKGPKG